MTSASPVATVALGAGSGPTSSSSNTGAIAGGVVGGVVGALLAFAVLFFIFRKRRRSHRDDFDDLMFDPNRAQNQGPVDLADASAAVVEPYHTPGVASTAISPQMSQYPRSAATTSDGTYSAHDLSRGPSTATSAGYAGRGAGGYGVESALPTPAMPASAGAAFGAGAAGAAGAGAMSAKQTEAFREQQRFRVQNQSWQPGQAGASGAAAAPPMSPTATSGSGGVTVHQDAGVVSDEEPTYASEIPPSYESIPR